ncbi:putative nuclease HARBI1 [Oryzias latipes]|uniref:putative nuclease HARBI1 n=1 Tax=Oryzias latipes TaxID=8090 RepID=UPI000CE25202|nr:putative nuclease HARBI1 [Oryzias latipes]
MKAQNFVFLSALTMACPFLRDVVDEEALVLRRAFRREKVFRDRLDPLAFPDDHLYERCRFSADGIRYLCRLLGPRIKHRTAWSHALSVEQMVCVALRFFASGAFLYSVGDAEQLNKATICRTIRSVCLAIKALADVFISFPGHRRLCDVKEEFYRIAGRGHTQHPPLTIEGAAVERVSSTKFLGVHFSEDLSWTTNTASLAKKAQQRSSAPALPDSPTALSIRLINVQMVCNADCVISNVVAKWPGSVHDSRIFRASEIYQCLSQGEFSGVLLGDRGYGCQPFLLTPFTDPQEAQQAYNHAHARTRTRVEMTFGLLKARFHCLHKLRVNPVTACDITVACAVLHNVACLKKERAPRVPPAMDWDNLAIFPDDDSGRLLRDQYELNYFS